ncbi:MAG: hypothetical protein GDA41_10600 [Rhodospirillales bacterium]|nr:hypothetical protein [Rhodospirillales bacterium]
MKRFSTFCVALSAAALLAGALPERAQSSEGTQLLGYRNGYTLMDVASYRQTEAIADKGVPQSVTTRLDLVRGPGRKNFRRVLSVTITPQGQTGGDPIIFSDIRVRLDGSYKKTLPGGHRIVGEISSFGSAAFSSPGGSIQPNTSGTYTAPGLRITYETDRNSGWLGTLRQMMYFGSYRQSEDNGQALAERRTDHEALVTSDGSEHIARGETITGRDGPKSTDAQIYIDDVNLLADRELNCSSTGVCDIVIDGQSYDIFVEKDFVPGDENDVDTVLSHEGIHLVLDRSQDNVTQSHLTFLSFGAWMDDAGFFVTTGSPNSAGGMDEPEPESVQIAFARGERTGNRPVWDAVWRGSMVGTVLAGERKDHLLRGDATLRFDSSKSQLSAHFFNIRDFDRFGEEHRMQEVQKGRQNRLRFGRIPVAADGSYARIYSEDEGGGNIRGAFYGDYHGETAGTFDRYGIIAAFGAKKVTNADFRLFRKTASRAARPEASKPEETAEVQLVRAGDALDVAGGLLTAGSWGGITAEIPGGDGSTTVVRRTNCAENQNDCDRLLRFDADGDGALDDDTDLMLPVEKEDFFGLRDDLESRAVLTKDGITLLRRRSGESSGDRPFDHTLYGAYMDDVGFVVGVDGDFAVPSGDGVTLRIPGRFVAASGDWADTSPTADATWRGLMVGTLRYGDDKDDLLQGNATLTFDMTDNTVDAAFSKIRNLDKGGGLHSTNKIRFRDMAVDEEGYYESGWEVDSYLQGGFFGDFFGDNHAETAGAFFKGDVIAAFGAKKVTNSGTIITPGTGLSSDFAFRGFQATAIAAAGLPEEHQPEETAGSQLDRAEDALEDAAYVLNSGVRVEIPGGDGTSTSPEYPSYTETGQTLGFFVNGKRLTLDLEKEDLFGRRDGVDEAVLTKNGITLLRRRSGEDSEDRPFDHTLYGAWMEHAGFAVAVDGSFAVADGDSTLHIPGRFAAASGDPTETRPMADATWKGLMVGTIRSGHRKNDLLQGDAELIFDMEGSRIDAVFSEIRKFYQDGRLYSGKTIRFEDVPVDGNGHYRYEGDGAIRGLFYGGGHAETAGAFTKGGISAAFGAKKVRKSGTAITPGSGLTGD